MDDPFFKKDTSGAAAGATVERRRAKRWPFSAVAEVTERSTATRLEVRVSDISLEGCYVDCLTTFPRATAVQITIRHGGMEFASAAMVVYSLTGMGMGLKFAELNKEKAGTIAKWLSGDAGEVALERGREGGPAEPAAERVLRRLVEMMMRKGQLNGFEGDELLPELRRK